MTMSRDAITRVLAIDPTTWGFGFAVMEDANLLIDWGTRTADLGDKNVRSLQLLAYLLEHYRPSVLVVQDLRKRSCERTDRVRELIEAAAAAAIERKVKVRRFPRQRVYQTFRDCGARNKEQIAAEIAKQLPELAPRLPPHRQPWMTENSRMAIFDAVALALTYFHFKAQRRKDALLDLGINSSEHVQL
jgi:Holliday junction resolvasome RuvABC endonuclease subunit